ncbi:MAG: hypothetical protein WC637_10510 [Victivallales bacterium]
MGNWIIGGIKIAFKYATGELNAEAVRKVHEHGEKLKDINRRFDRSRYKISCHIDEASGNCNAAALRAARKISFMMADQAYIMFDENRQVMRMLGDNLGLMKNRKNELVKTLESGNLSYRDREHIRNQIRYLKSMYEPIYDKIEELKNNREELLGKVRVLKMFTRTVNEKLNLIGTNRNFNQLA